MERRGLTLIELLIFVGIFSVAVGGAIAILAVVTRVGSDQISQVSVQTEGQFITQQLQYYIRTARLAAMPQDTATGTLALTQPGASDFNFIYASSGTMYIKQGVNATPAALSSNKVKVSNLSFARHFTLNGSSSAYGRDSISYSFTLEANTSNTTMQFTESFQSAAALPTAVGKIALVQQAKGETGGAAGSVNATFAKPPTTGNLLVAVVSNTGGSSADINLSDSLTNTWTRHINVPYQNFNQQISVYSAVNSGSAPDTVTASFSPSVTSPSIFIYEYRGAAPSTPFDLATSSIQANTSTPSSGSMSPSTATTELVLGILYSNPSTEIPTAGSGFTLLTTSTVSGTYVEEMNQFLVGPVRANWTYTQTTPSSSAAMVTFK